MKIMPNLNPTPLTSMSYITKRAAWTIRGGGRPVGQIAAEKMLEKAERQVNEVQNHTPGEALTIVSHVTYSVICRNEIANRAIREAVSAARSCKPIFRQIFKKHVNELSVESARYDSMIAQVSLSEGQEDVLTFADEYADLFTAKTENLVHDIEQSILWLMNRHNLKYPEMIAKFHTASILCQLTTGRLQNEIDSYRQQCFNVRFLGYLKLSKLETMLNTILADINVLLVPKDDNIVMNQDEHITAAVERFADYALNYDNVMQCVDEVDKRLNNQDDDNTDV